MANAAIRGFVLLFMSVLGWHAQAWNSVDGKVSSVPASWSKDILDPNSSPVDLSFLNAAEVPAGKRGFLQASGDRLVFQDGTEARFWGTNITSYALFGTDHANIKRQARRLSQLGFNLVRIHHHDSDWVNPNIFGDEKAPDTRHLNPDALDKIDWWIKCLKDEGIYVWLDLHDGRRFKSGDNIDGFSEISHGGTSAELKGYNYVNISIQRAMETFNEALLNHVNRYTGLRYADEPAIAVLLITNENDVTQHYGNALLGDKGVPYHSALYTKEADRFARQRGLSAGKVQRAWEFGPPKLFLNDLEQRFDTSMIGHLRQHGAKVPIVTTSTWGNPLSSLPALTSGDMIDVHLGSEVGELKKNPLVEPTLIDWAAAAHVAGKPLSITEWGVENRGGLASDRHTIPLYLAATGNQQGWSVIMHFAYSQEPFGGRATASIYHAYNDPAMFATLPAAALLFRSRHVRESGSIYAFVPAEDLLFGQRIDPRTSIMLRTAPARGKLVVVMPRTKALPWLEPSVVPGGANVLKDPKQSLLQRDSMEATSDSGELRRDWKRGIFTINTPATQAAMGAIGSVSIALNDIRISTTSTNATIAVQSLDAKPIRQSRKLLISLGANSVPRNGSSLPFYSEPVEGTLQIHAPKGLRLYVRDQPGGEHRCAQMRYANGMYTIALSGEMKTYWLTMH